MNSILGNALSERITDDPGNPETARFSKLYMNSRKEPESILKGHSKGYIIKTVGPQKVKKDYPTQRKFLYHVIGSDKDQK